MTHGKDKNMSKHYGIPTPQGNVLVAQEWARENLRSIMEFGTVVYSNGDGTAFDPGVIPGYIEEEAYCVDVDENGQADELSDADLPDGWSWMTGHSGQCWYWGSIMSPAEYIGGGLADRILEEGGWYCAVIVSTYPSEEFDSEVIGWAIAHKPESR